MTNKEVKSRKKSLKSTIKPIAFCFQQSPLYLIKKKAGALACFKDFNKLHKSIFRISENPDALTFDRILGSSPSFTIVKEQARQIANQDITVLLIGESGTGKELFARAIHHESPRRNEIFLPINCGAIPDSLIEK